MLLLLLLLLLRVCWSVRLSYLLPKSASSEIETKLIWIFFVGSKKRIVPLKDSPFFLLPHRYTLISASSAIQFKQQFLLVYTINGASVTRLGDLLNFGQVFKAFGNN